MLHNAQLKLISEQHVGELVDMKPFWFKDRKNSVYSSVFSTPIQKVVREGEHGIAAAIYFYSPMNPLLPTYISADSPSNRCTQSTHTHRLSRGQLQGWCPSSNNSSDFDRATEVPSETERLRFI